MRKLKNKVFYIVFTGKEKAMRYENVKISMDLFIKIIWYIYMDNFDLKDEIVEELQKKLDKLELGEVCTKMHMCKDPVEKEKYQQQFCNLAGIHPDFRW